MSNPRVGDEVLMYVQWHKRHTADFIAMVGHVIEAHSRADCITARFGSRFEDRRLTLPPVTGTSPPWVYTILAGDKRDVLTPPQKRRRAAKQHVQTD